jgi:phosphodiesterase/alkaline phosphatase D-like protein
MSRQLQLSPIVGVSSNGARVWFKDLSDVDYKLLVTKRFDATVLPVARRQDDNAWWFFVDNLNANTEYEYRVVDNADSEVLAIGRFATLPAENAELDFSFAFFSCHKPAEDGSLVMWDRLAALSNGASRVNDPASLRFALGVGDQVYVDEMGWSLAERGLEAMDYLKLDYESLALHCDTCYNEYWRFRSLRHVYSNCPAFFTWDDHEIRDGWGSRKKDRTTPQLLHVYGAAEEAFIKHQLRHNPFCTSPNTKKYYSFRFGKTGFIVTDLRGERDAKTKQMMSQEQWTWLSDTLQTYSSQCQAVFVVTSVPFFHPVRGATKFAVNLLDLFSKDELEDSWNCGQWETEGARFAKLLFDVQTAPGQRGQLYLLGGDVHVATCAEIRFGSDHQAAVIPQFTSSAISNTTSDFVRIARGNIRSDDWKRIYDGHIYEGRLPHFVAARNFGVVSVAYDGSGRCNVKYELHHERSDVPATLYDGELITPPVVIS